MDELDLFRGFRSGVSEPSPEAQRQALARLTLVIKPHQRTRIPVLDLLRDRPRRVALGAAVLVGAVAVALFVTAPWSRTPGFLERAQAALVPPTGSILHFSWVDRTSVPGFGCTSSMKVELWIDGRPPNRYRALVTVPKVRPTMDVRAYVCPRTSEQLELGSQVEATQRGLLFVAPNTLVRTNSAVLPVPADPVADLRLAIRDGRAHDEGRTKLEGRTVERIRIDPEPYCPRIMRCRKHPSYAYVDPETFTPVREEIPGTVGGGPLKHGIPVDIVRSYRAFEYLARNPADLALTSIRAQHPHATLKCTPTWQDRC
jgi:hypothetical protein